MKKIMFVCLGNICRSPMAEFIMKDLVNRAGRADSFQIASAAVSSEALGCPMDSRTVATLRAHRIPYENRRAQKLTETMGDEYDLLIGMDEGNLARMRHIVRKEDLPKLHLLNEYSGIPHTIADPWYTGDFETAFKEIRKGCRGLLDGLV